MTNNNNRQTASDQRIAHLSPQLSRLGNLNGQLINNNNNNNYDNDNLAPRENTYSYNDNHNF